MQSSSATVVQSAAFALSNLARGQSDSVSEMMRLGIAQICMVHLSPVNTPVDVMAEVAWTLTYLTARQDFVSEFVSLGIIGNIVQLLSGLSQETPHNSQGVTPLLRSLGESCSGYSLFRQLFWNTMKTMFLCKRCI